MFSIIIILTFFMCSSFHLSNNFLKIAHRGLSEHYKDNSILSFKKAIDNNFDMIEMDIQFSQNNEIILYHDNHINNIYINELSTKKLIEKYDIITLEYFFQNFPYKDVKINFDLKGNDEYLVDELLLLLNKYNVDTNLIYISSFDRNLLKNLIILRSKYNMNFKSGFISSNIFTHEEIDFLLKSIDFYVLDYTLLTHDIINYCHKKGILVFTYTNKDIYTYDIITRYNVDGVFSDCKFPDINQI